jgi:hypothetical protein
VLSAKAVEIEEIGGLKLVVWKKLVSQCYNLFKMSFWVKKLLLFSIIAILAIFFMSSNALARSGCCSWHDGVCGCDTSVGRQVCCDGTYSPTCTCTYYPQKQYYSPTPTPRPTSTPTPKPTLTPTPTPDKTSIPIDTPTLSPEVKGESTENIQSVEKSEDSDSGILLPLGALGLAGYWLYKKRIKKEL